MVYLSMTELRVKLAGRSRASIYKDLTAGRLPRPIKLGGKLLWIESEVEERLASLRENAGAGQ